MKKVTYTILALLTVFALMMTGCPDGGKTETSSVTSVTVSPSTATVAKGGTSSFTATVTGTGNPATTVTWSVTGGITGTSISNAGLLTVAAAETAATLTVKATSTVDTSKSGTATVTVTGGSGGEEPTDGLKITVAGVEKKVEVIAEGGDVELNEDKTGYTFTKTSDYERSYAYFAVNFGTDKFNDYEKITFVYQGVSGDIGYKYIFLMANDEAFSGDLTGKTGAATISDQKQMDGTSETNVELAITRTTATGFTNPKVYLCLYINADKDKSGAATVIKISNIELVKSATPFVPVKVDILTIPSVRAPVDGQAPVETLSNVQYTGAVTWAPAVSGNFVQGTSYTATIALTAKTGYTFNGVVANAFTVSGATAATNVAGTAETLTITATFPVTASSVPDKLITFPSGTYIGVVNGSVVLETDGSGFTFTTTQGNKYAFPTFKVTFASGKKLSDYTKISYKITSSGTDSTYKKVSINATAAEPTTAPLDTADHINKETDWGDTGFGNASQEYARTVTVISPLPTGSDLNEVWITFYTTEANAGLIYKVTDIKFHN